MKTISIIKKNEEFTNCFISDEETEGRLISVNEKYLAMSKKYKDKEEEGILIVDSSKPININQDLPILTWNNNNTKIYDMEFSPFNNNLLASCYKNKSVLLWKIQENSPNNNLTTNQFSTYSKHNNKVNFVNFNPIKSDEICSSTIDGEIHVWNIEKRDDYISLKTDNNPITTISWNLDGSLIGATSKYDIDLFDPRKKEKLFSKHINQFSLSSKYVWVDDHYFSTISWVDNIDNRMLQLWDIRHLDKEINSIKIDKSINIGIPFANNEKKLLYVFGKQEKLLYVFDYSKGIFEKNNKFDLNETSIYPVIFNRKNLNNNEIDRFAIYTSNNKIYYLSCIINDKGTFSDNLSSHNETIDLEVIDNQSRQQETEQNLNNNQNLLENLFSGKKTKIENQIKEKSNKDKNPINQCENTYVKEKKEEKEDLKKKLEEAENKNKIIFDLNKHFQKV